MSWLWALVYVNEHLCARVRGRSCETMLLVTDATAGCRFGESSKQGRRSATKLRLSCADERRSKRVLRLLFENLELLADCSKRLR